MKDLDRRNSKTIKIWQNRQNISETLKSEAVDLIKIESEVLELRMFMLLFFV